MADNTSQTGTDTIRTRDRSSVKTPVGLLDISNGTDAELLGLSPSQIFKVSTTALTTSTTAYVAGDVYNGELSISNAVRASGKGGQIVSAMVKDYGKVAGAMRGLVFDSASTPAADNAANSWADADIDRLIGVIDFETPIVSANNAYARGVGGLPIIIQPTATTLYVVLVALTGHTFFASTSDLRLVLGIQPD